MGIKTCASPGYNFAFREEDGLFLRWGKDENDDPLFSPFGPEILDLEISVNGCPNSCPWCYKSNTSQAPTNMSLETFRTILDKMPPTLCQIAFGITGVKTNPDFLKMMELCREHRIVPNFTLSGIDADEEFIKESAKLIGAVAVSCYEGDEETCYDTVSSYHKAGVEQTNIHFMLSEETVSFAYQVINDIKKWNIPVHALVFLGVKPKGRARGHFTSVSQKKFDGLVSKCEEVGINCGFDSCSAPKYANHIQGTDKAHLITFVEPCESSLFSAYINVFGAYFSCSFSEGEEPWEGVDVLAANDFVKDVWFHPEVKEFRRRLLETQDSEGIRKCIVFPEIN